MRQGKVYFKDLYAGKIVENESGYIFKYDRDYLKLDEAYPISLTLPLQEHPFQSDRLFPFFDGLIPEGWLLTIAERNWKLNPRDRMGLLLATCKDCIGAVSVVPE